MDNNTNNVNQNNMMGTTGVTSPQLTQNPNVVGAQTQIPTPTQTPIQTPNNQTQEVNVTASQVVDLDTSDDTTPSGDASDITFDYNEIYGVQENEVKEESSIDENIPVYNEKEIVIDEDRLKKDTEDVVPEFRIDELEGNAKAGSNKSLDEIRDDKEADKADTRRKIAYILAIALILIIFVWFIFPIMAGYNL